MRDIPIDPPTNQLPVFSFLIYGDTRTGKTEFTSTFPRPYVIADVAESGYKTIQRMDRSKWFEPNMPPIIKGIDNMNDVAKLSPEIDQLIASGRVRTVVFDAFSFYIDFYLAQLIKLEAKPDNRQMYGKLGIHLREVRTNYHSKGINTAWNCLAKHPDPDDVKGRPMLPGQQSDKFAAGCDFLFHSRIDQQRENGKIARETFELRTRQYGTYIVGNRLGASAAMLPDPFVGTYADLIACLGYDVEALRRSLPKVGATVVTQPGIKPATPVATSIAAPAVTNTNGRGPVVINRPAPKAATPPQVK